MTRRWLLVAVAIATVAVTATPGLSGGQPVAGESSLSDGNTVAPNETRIVHAGDELTLEAGPGQAVRGRTPLPPGSVITVRVRSTNDHPYIRSTTAVVGADRAFRAVFDLSTLPSGTPIRVVVHRQGENLTATAGEVVPCSSCPPATPATPSAVILHEGARLTVVDAPGQVVRSRTNLPPGTEVTVRLRSSSTSPFITQQTATVADNGTVRAVFGLDDAQQGTEFRASLRYNGTELTTAPGRIACRGGCEATSTPGGDAYAGAEVGVVQVANGSVARVRLRLGDADSALLTVRSPATSYELAATVRDGNGDGEVVVRFDTTAAARASAPLTVASDADRVRVHGERGQFGATDYRLVLHPPDDESVEVATGLLVVTQNGTDRTPLLTVTPGQDGSLPLGSAAALVGGATLAVLGLGVLLGLVDVRDLFSRL